MDFSFLKNPIVLAIIAGVLTYLYMNWENKRKQEENPKANIEDVSYTTPIIVGLLVLFISQGFLGAETKEIPAGGDPVGHIIDNPSMPQLVGGGAKSNDILGQAGAKMSDTWNSEIYHLVGRNAIKLPQTDVFIDIAKF